jgi:hypothetical protein
MNAGGYIRDRVFVGRYCSIGRRVTLGAGMHNMYGVSTPWGCMGLVQDNTPMQRSPDWKGEGSLGS